jgi:prophage regulatory protein
MAPPSLPGQNTTAVCLSTPGHAGEAAALFITKHIRKSLLTFAKTGVRHVSNSRTAPYTRTIRKHQLKEMVPLADSTIFEMEQRGEFPRRYALSPRTVVWDLAEVEAWLAERKAKPIRRGQHVDVHDRRTRPVKGSDRVRGAASLGG